MKNNYDITENRAPLAAKGYLVAQDKAQKIDFRSPLWGSVDRDNIIKKGDRIFNEGYASCDKNTFCTLRDFEEDMKAKIGPMSLRSSLEERMDSILEYWDNDEKDVVDMPEAGTHLAINEGKAKTNGTRAKILTSKKAILEDMELSTNSGLPYFTKRRLVVNDTLDEFNLLIACNYPAVLGGRGQEGGPKTKERAIFMFPFQVNIAELAVYKPLIKLIQQFKLIPAYVSDEEVDITVTKMFDSKGANDLVIATDFKKMDQHFSIGMRSSALTQIHNLFHESVDFSLGKGKIFPIKYEIGLQISPTKMIMGEHGMGSGSGGTNGDESLAHRALQHQAAHDNHSVLNEYSQFLGDDGIITFPGITVEKVVKSYTKYGNIMNPEKQYAHTDATIYLRRGHHNNYRLRVGESDICVGVYSTYRALGKLMGHERYMNPKYGSKKDVILRSLSILENVKGHPLFQQLVDFVIKGDKYRLGINIAGFYHPAKLQEAGKKYKANNPSSDGRKRVQSCKTSINDGEVVKYIKSKYNSNPKSTTLLNQK